MSKLLAVLFLISPFLSLTATRPRTQRNPLKGRQLQVMSTAGKWEFVLDTEPQIMDPSIDKSLNLYPDDIFKLIHKGMGKAVEIAARTVGTTNPIMSRFQPVKMPSENPLDHK